MSSEGRPERNGAASLARFDDLAASYDRWFATKVGRYVDEREKKVILGMVLAAKPRTVLEVGSGTGRYLEALAASGASCVGIEPSAGMLRAALARPSHAASYVLSAGEVLPFRDSAFDVVLFMTTLEFVRDPAAALREAFRVVHPAGCLVLGVLNAAGPWARARKREGGLWSEARFYTAAELEALLAPLGAIQVASCVHLPPGLTAKLPRFLLGPADGLLRHLFPRSGALLAVAVTLGSEE